MAVVVGKRSDGTVLVEVPAVDAAGLEIGADVEVRPVAPAAAREWPSPFGALAGKLPVIEIEDIKAARREALHGTAR